MVFANEQNTCFLIIVSVQREERRLHISVLMSNDLQYSCISELYNSRTLLSNVVYEDEILRDWLNDEWIVIEIGLRDYAHVNRSLWFHLFFTCILGVGVKLFETQLLLLVLVHHCVLSLIIDWHDAVVLDALECCKLNGYLSLLLFNHLSFFKPISIIGRDIMNQNDRAVRLVCALELHKVVIATFCQEADLSTNSIDWQFPAKLEGVRNYTTSDQRHVLAVLESG